MGSVKHPTDPGVEKDFADLLRLFNAHKVDYCIVGAFAVGFHAISRYTKDMDLLVHRTPRPDTQQKESRPATGSGRSCNSQESPAKEAQKILVGRLSILGN
ncbi:MAG: hypothetical protein A2053_05895 [Deltaproteobacteria bacterium GWA2_50_8]|nr:MAG: hypothetical protein A2053_05895 [Deltaproteobacteria bacterium GWA2_50_8]